MKLDMKLGMYLFRICKSGSDIVALLFSKSSAIVHSFCFSFSIKMWIKLLNIYASVNTNSHIVYICVTNKIVK